ncbi:TrbL/VirB6 plasmid conjugal transfer protein [Selenomonas ruminantium]|uniref:TrbL/VirB6 plasmid conjugal transfer protein n=2 Tax=Selenomonas ruminantium TaxID=971 RepID=A0A1H3VQZ7_SELRU|nr:TrbL/VirB6 plasmid conjugal transfer protein [Selenomonas ruminantium]
MLIKWLIILVLMVAGDFGTVGAAPAYHSMMNPVEGELEVTSDFGWRTHPIYGTQKFHSGIDFGYDYGMPVHAASSGTVTTAGWVSGYGYLVAIDHGSSIETLYGHNEMLTVTVGQTVQMGDVIAYAGSTGNSTGPHCHFEVRLNGEPVNPWDWLSGTPPSGAGGMMMDEDIVAVNYDAYYDFCKPIREMTEKIAEVCTKGLRIIQDNLRWLFWALMTIDIAIQGLGMLLGEDRNAIYISRWLASKCIFYGFLTYLFWHWGDLANILRDYFVTMGAFATGNDYATAGKILSDPAAIVEIGARYVGPIFEYLGTMWGISIMFHLPTVIICLLTIICVLACFFYIGIMIAMAYIEFYCTALFSLLGFSFTPFQGTRSFGATAITGLVMSTIKLMVMTVTALLLVVALKDSVPKDYFDTSVQSVAAGGNFQSVEEFAAAIRQVETGGCEDPYHTPSADGYGYGAYQISYSNWESWCAEAGITPAPDMPWPPEVQDVVAKHKMQVLYEQYGNWHDVAIVWNAGSVVSWDEAYWQKVINSGGMRIEKTIKLTVLLKMMLVALAAMIFGHEDCKVIMELFAGYGFRFKRQGMIRGFRL